MKICPKCGGENLTLVDRERWYMMGDGYDPQCNGCGFLNKE
jgi:hypothetical protein